MSWGSPFAALLLTLGMAVGILGLGRLARVDGSVRSWVVGFQLLWWSGALVGAVAGPYAGALTVLAVAAGGVAAWAVRRPAPGRAAVLGLLVVAGAPIYLAPPFFYDALVYHLGMPWSWLQNGSMAPIPHNLFSHFPLAASVVFLGPVGLGLSQAAAGLHWTAMVLAVLAAVELGRRAGAERWAWIAGACTVASWHGLWLAGLAAADWFVVLGLTVAAAEIVSVLKGGAPPAPWLAGLALGMALATKYTAIMPVAALLVALLLVRPKAWRWSALLGLVAVASSSFWYLRNLLGTGNPVYPLLWDLLGGRGWSATENARYLAAVRVGVDGWQTVPRGLKQLFHPASGLGVWLGLAVFLWLAALWRCRDDRRVVWLSAVVALMVAGWLATAHVTRFALAIGPILGTLAAVGVASLGKRTRRGVAVGAVVVVLAGVLQYAGFAFGTLHWSSWMVDGERWRHTLTVDDPMPAYRAADRFLARGAKILIVGEARSWGCPRPHHASSARDTQLVQAVVERAGSVEEAVATLRSEGFTHMVINWREVARLHGPPSRMLAWRDGASRDRWQRLLEERTVPVWKGDGLELLAFR